MPSHTLDAALTPTTAPEPPSRTDSARQRLRGLSFHQCLLAAFLLVTALLGGVAAQAMFALEHVAVQGRQASQEAAALTAQVQRLAERTVAMERSARQFLVLDDAGLRQRYEAAWADAKATQRVLAELMADAAAARLLTEWAAQADTAWDVLRTPGPQRLRAPALKQLTPVFARLHRLNELLTERSQQAIDQRSDAVLAELEQQRRLISALVLGAIALVVPLSLGLGHWLLRPLAHVEAAIGRLGDNRFDQPIAVGGPADLRRIGRQLEWLRQRLAALEADKTRFVRHISHELKTPMASIREGAALLRDGVAGPLTPDQTEIVRILGDNSAALQRQIEDLLRYQTLASDSQQLQCRPTLLHELLMRIVDEQRLLWQARGLQVKVEAEPACRAAVDGEKLGMALGNLLANAVRFSPPGGTVTLALAPHEGGVRIDCIDAGPGVAPEDVPHIFDPFYQGRNQAPGARRGSGIGLSIVREIVQAHGGNCRLLPSDRGAHFVIEIPHAPDATTA